MAATPRLPFSSWAVGPISPGELIAIFGTNIGPSAPAPMSVTGGYVDTSLSGVSVSIDGKPAPIIYASANQVNVQVPYDAGARNQNGRSPTVRIRRRPRPLRLPPARLPFSPPTVREWGKRPHSTTARLPASTASTAERR